MEKLKKTNSLFSHDTIKVIDLFAGVGGIRLGFQLAAEAFGLKTKCVFTSEIDVHACKTYQKNFPQDCHNPNNDITKVSASEIPDFDVLLAGFPCQAFSIAGKRGGFEDTRGTLFFDVARIIKEKKPSAFILENVKGLTNHRGGRTLDTILHTLIDDLGYSSTVYKVLNAKNYGVPQNRERIIIVGFRDCGGGFSFPETTDDTKTIKDIIESKPVVAKYYLSETYVASMRKHRERHEAKGNGFGYEIKSYSQIANAIVCGGMGKERNLVIDMRQKDLTPTTHIKGKINLEGIRKMTPVEWERLQGFPDNWTNGIADVHRYKQMGNSVAVPMIENVSLNVIAELVNPTPFVVKQKTKQSFLF